MSKEIVSLPNLQDAKEEFFKQLVDNPPSEVASNWIFERIPYIFDGSLSNYIKWKHVFAEKLHVDSGALIMTGTACVGFSLNPYKNYKLFDSRSDIDVAVISDHYFTEGWHCLRETGSKILRMPGIASTAVKEHVTKYIYWGTIATDKILPYLPFASQWQSALKEMKSHPSTGGREIKVRIYKDVESLRYYHVANLKRLQQKRLQLGETA